MHSCLPGTTCTSSHRHSGTEAGQSLYPSFTCVEARAYKIKGVCPRTSGLAPDWRNQDSNVGYVAKAQHAWLQWEQNKG